MLILHVVLLIEIQMDIVTNIQQVTISEVVEAGNVTTRLHLQFQIIVILSTKMLSIL
jgi:hypothetical protein